MTKLLSVLLAAAAISTCGAKSPFPVEEFTTPTGGKVQVYMIHHGSIALSYKGFNIQVDPVAKMGQNTIDYSSFPKADLILVTHEHGDHLDADAIDALTKDGTRLLMNPRSCEQLGRGEVVLNGDRIPLTDNILLEAVPAYNTTEGREKFHPKGNGNGYVLSIDGLRIYIAGDTEDIPEMAALKDIDVAFLPVNQPYTMTVEQCVSAAKAIQPKVLIPYHYSQTDLTGLPALLPDMDVRIRQMQ